MENLKIRLSNSSKTAFYRIDNDRFIGKVESEIYDDKEIARRICAAVNATAGIPTFDLETLPIDFEAMAQDRIRLQTENERLRAENADLIKMLDTSEPIGKVIERVLQPDSTTEATIKQHPKKSHLWRAEEGDLVIGGWNSREVAEQTAAAWNAYQKPNVNERLLEAAKQVLEDCKKAVAAGEAETYDAIRQETFKMLNEAIAHAEAHQPATFKRLMDAAQKIADSLNPLGFQGETRTLIRELQDALRDPHGWEPRGIIAPATGDGPTPNALELYASCLVMYEEKLCEAVVTEINHEAKTFNVVFDRPDIISTEPMLNIPFSKFRHLDIKS